MYKSMNVFDHKLPKGSEIRCSEMNEYFLSHMCHPSRFTFIGSPSCVIFGEQTLQHDM